MRAPFGRNRFVVSYSVYCFSCLITISDSASVSYNRPYLHPCALWNANATTIANSTTISSSSYGLFINTNNTRYANSRKKNTTYMWLENNFGPTSSFSANLVSPAGIFVTTAKDVYIDNGVTKNEVVMWSSNQSSSVVVMNVSGRCHSLFVDISNNLYCSLGDEHRIVKKSLNVSVIMPTTIAGNGSNGSAFDLLWSPYGIFVDVTFKLYVADSGNNRVQLFESGQSNGTTMVGSGSASNFPLSIPTGVALDGDGYLFIVDKGMHRIVGSGPYGYRCVAGCSNTNGSTADRLYNPFSLAFDSHGHIFVLDVDNIRIQKFIQVNSSCVGFSTAKALLTTSFSPTIATTPLEQTSIGITTTFPLTTVKVDPTTAMLTTTTTVAVATTISTTTSGFNDITSTSTEKATTLITTTPDEFEHITSISTERTSVVHSTTEESDHTTIISTEVTTVTTSDPLSTTSEMINLSSLWNDPSTAIIDTTAQLSTATPSKLFIAPQCANASYIGPFCDIPAIPASTCLNGGILYFSRSVAFLSSCLCATGFNGSVCQYDYRICKPGTCWNNGSCTASSTMRAVCACSPGWQGVYCETRISYCGNITCSNNAICRSLLLDYKCECLTTSFSGRYCENKANSLVVKEIVCRTLGYVAALAVGTVVLFVVILDVMKYVFGIDPARQKHCHLSKRVVRARPTPPVVTKLTYVN